MLKLTVEKIRDQEEVSERPIPADVAFLYDKERRHFSDMPPDAKRRRGAVTDKRTQATISLPTGEEGMLVLRTVQLFADLTELACRPRL